ncbi:hypothetical protein, partial [Pseudomonas chlororaphis]|uniref:hypothetical protein n=1 Tax=Pseudomonas chlororaphis TaxID=587753 RepID=UPI001B32E8F3
MKTLLAIVAMVLSVLIRPVVADELVQHGFNLLDQKQESGWFQKVAGGEPPPSYMGPCGAPTPDHQDCDSDQKPVCWPSNNGVDQGPCSCRANDPVSGAKLCP